MIVFKGITYRRVSIAPAAPLPRAVFSSGAEPADCCRICISVMELCGISIGMMAVKLESDLETVALSSFVEGLYESRSWPKRCLKSVEYFKCVVFCGTRQTDRNG
jgi:hypothetical protein